MKLYSSIGPNPKIVRMFLAEKSLDAEIVEVDLVGGENRREPFIELNPMGQLPLLEDDAGRRISEVTAICEYLEERQPEPSLIGRTPAERAETRMWVRRIDLNILEPMAGGFRFAEGLQLFQSRIHCLPEAADGLKTIARKNLAWLETQIGEKEYICGDRFSLADIMTYCFVNFFGRQGQPLDPGSTRLQAWFERVKARPSAKA